MFTSEEEALAAAEEVWVKYIAAANLMGRSGGTDLSGFEGILSEKQLADEVQAARKLSEQGRRLDGTLGYYVFHLQQYHEDGAPGAYLQAYVCADLSEVRYLNADGSDNSAPGHATWIPYEVVFITDGAQPPFIIREVIRWTGRDFCAPQQ